jgi:hypothetical protein
VTDTFTVVALGHAPYVLAFLLLGMPRPVVDATKDHDFDVVQAIV